jgi:helix-turn-helix protein
MEVDVSNARFSIIQAKAVRDPRVSDAQLRVLNALGMYSDKDGWCYPSQSTLAEDINRSRQTVNGYVADLVELGYVEKHRRFDNSVLYRLLFDTPLVEPALQGLSSVPDTNVPYNAPNTNTAGDEKTVAATPLPIEWQIAAGKEITELPDQQDAQYKDTAMIIAMGFGIQQKLAYELAYAFMSTRQILIPSRKVKSQRAAVREMMEMGVTPNHVREAVEKLTTGKRPLTVTDLYSVSKTAIDLANPLSNTEHAGLDGL